MKSKKSPAQLKRIVTVDQLVTLNDLQEAKRELIIEIKNILDDRELPQPTRWLKSYEVKELLQVSTGKLFMLRRSGNLPYSKIGGVIFYHPTDVQQMLERKQNSTNQSNESNEEKP